MSRLHDAVNAGDLHEVSRLLTKRPWWLLGRTMINKKNGYGWSALHIAARRGDAEAVELLVKSGARVDIRGKDGWAPIHLAAFYGHIAAVRSLAGCGADVNVRNEWGKLQVVKTMRSFNNEAIEITMILMNAHSAGIEIRDGTPRQLAKSNRHGAVAKVLADLGGT